MAYRIFKKLLTKEDYYKSWVSDDYLRMTEYEKELVYNKYKMRCEVMQRDEFACQYSPKGKGCPFCKSVKEYHELTVHHIKALRNGGKNSARNGITLCDTSHKGYERKKMSLEIANNSNLPKHIKGHTFVLSKSNEINWKALRVESKKFRKTLKEHYGVDIDPQRLIDLLKWLKIYYVD